MNDLFENLFRGGLWLCAWALLTLSLPSFGQAKSDLAAAPLPNPSGPSGVEQIYTTMLVDSGSPLSHLALDIPLDLPSGNSSQQPTNAFTGVTPKPSGESPADTKLRWGPAIRESLLFTGIMQAFNLGTEAGTRDALNGHWFDDYLDSVSELRGWSDSDKFMAPYVGHTIQGDIHGFTERQNDPKYRKVQFGDGRDYYISLLRSLAYSAVWHTQWKIGPISEASIGNVMLHASPGFITLTDTPTLGDHRHVGRGCRRSISDHGS